MKLKHLLKGLEYRVLDGNLELDITDISINSKQVTRDNLFIAIQGFKTDGHRFAAEAVEREAAAVVLQKEVALPAQVTRILVEDTRKSLAVISGNFFRHPSKDLNIIGVTGTNGKTTTCFLIDSILREAGIPASLVTTVKSYMGDKKVNFDRTTPDSLQLNRFFRQSLDLGISTVCMEVSSHSVDLGRVDYLDFEGFVFTNLSQDHLDYHRDMESYFGAKRRLFVKENRKIYGGSFAVVNTDDAYGRIILNSTDLKTTCYSIENRQADLWAENIRNSIEGIEFELHLGSGKTMALKSALCGRFNVYNILGAAGTALNLGIADSYIGKGIRSLKGVPGRFEKITDERFSVIVDYAHTPDGLENVLNTAKDLLPDGGKLITVFGCGGDRDVQKRDMMGKISSKYSSFSIITSDNPRSEEPMAIIDMIAGGFKDESEYIKIVDRRKAISRALSMAGRKDIILIAGKGHEDYQEFKDYRIHFSDQEIVRDILDNYGRS
ncbi:MAG: UDP-N-acetylmuramoyl-L-alanyl-D-glutamate--2,6-diaminopimelate ligase [Actinomycetota bacterium]